MRYILTISLVYLLLEIGSTSASGCPSGYSTIDNTTCYKVTSKAQNRGLAAAFCAYDGGTLASVSNGFTNTYIYQMAKAQQADPVWLGIKCPGGDISRCKNDDQSSFGPYSNFYKGNPSSSVGNCVVMSLSGVTNQQWLSYNCSIQRPTAPEAAYVCAIPYGIKTRCPNKYAYFQGKCYYFSYPFGNTRELAVKKCKSVTGGFLATIPNSDVNEFLMDIELKHTYNNPLSYFGLQCPSIKFDGDVSSCKWDDGTLFSYNAFFPGEPTLRDNDMCNDFNDGGWTNDMDCGVNEFFCQAPSLN